jgi:multimeric flavodoxin WrbA
MKILGIVCSPRKDGNTEILVREALDTAREAGCETELILLAGKKINPCNGCNVCLKEGACNIKDDMQDIYAQLEKADGVIFGTPVYFYSVTAQAKAVIDRTYPLAFSGKLRNKVAAAIVVAGNMGVGQALSLLYTFFDQQRMIIAGSGTGYGNEKGDVKKDGAGATYGGSAIEEARSAGKRMVKLIAQLERGKVHKPSAAAEK